jgi:hypothetical protein
MDRRPPPGSVRSRPPIDVATGVAAPRDIEEENKEFERFTIEAFEATAPKNALRGLSPGDRLCLVMYLNSYAIDSVIATEGTAKDELETFAEAVAEAERAADKLNSVVFNGPYKLHAWALEYRSLPRQLKELCRRLQMELDYYGKRGHKAELAANSWLVSAVELVKLKLGQPCYEDIAELYQAVDQSTMSQDLSGDAIRKKVGYIKRKYHLIFHASVQVMLQMVLTSAVIERDPVLISRVLGQLTSDALRSLPSWLNTFIGPPKDSSAETRLKKAINSALARHPQRDLKP